jgi:hypothetical protein
MKRLAFIPLAAIVFGACQEAPTSDSPLFEIVDAVHNAGSANFFFLPPMVPEPDATGVFDGALAPVVEICEWTGIACVAPLLATFTTTTGPGSETVRVDAANEHYIVNWHTDEFNLDDGNTYRISVSVDGQELGHADVDVVSSGNELKNVDTGLFVPLKDGRTLPIKFRIEEPTCVAPPSGLVSWWPGDGNATDIADGNDGTLQNGATFDAGKVGQAFSLDGVDDYVDVPDSPNMSLGNKDMTVVAWVNIAAKTGEGIVTKTSAFSGTRGGDWDLRWSLPPVDRFQFRVYQANGAPVGVVNADNLGSPQIGVWYFVVASYDRVAGTVNIQVDNGPADNVAAVGVAGDDIFPVRIGAWGDSRSPVFNGKVDEVQFFDRVLTPAEIQAEFLAGSAGKCKP